MVRGDRGPAGCLMEDLIIMKASQSACSQVQCEKWEADHWVAREDEGAGNFVSCLKGTNKAKKTDKTWPSSWLRKGPERIGLGVDMQHTEEPKFAVGMGIGGLTEGLSR